MTTDQYRAKMLSLLKRQLYRDQERIEWYAMMNSKYVRPGLFRKPFVKSWRTSADVCRALMLADKAGLYD